MVRTDFARANRAGWLYDKDEMASSIVSVGRIVPVVAHAVPVFGDEHKATHWLSTPLVLLDNRSPSELMETDEGLKRVDQILTRIEHNIPS
jgi:putative toxin-antitoxin system antitoxin component (TIGR02293 family)